MDASEATKRTKAARLRKAREEREALEKELGIIYTNVASVKLPDNRVAFAVGQGYSCHQMDNGKGWRISWPT